jgi:hypothetical protein
MAIKGSKKESPSVAEDIRIILMEGETFKSDNSSMSDGSTKTPRGGGWEGREG